MINVSLINNRFLITDLTVKVYLLSNYQVTSAHKGSCGKIFNLLLFTITSPTIFLTTFQKLSLEFHNYVIPVFWLSLQNQF